MFFHHFPKDIQFQGVSFQAAEKTQEVQWVFVYQGGGINQLGKNPCGFLKSFPIQKDTKKWPSLKHSTWKWMVGILVTRCY